MFRNEEVTGGRLTGMDGIYIYIFSEVLLPVLMWIVFPEQVCRWITQVSFI